MTCWRAICTLILKKYHGLSHSYPNLRHFSWLPRARTVIIATTSTMKGIVSCWNSILSSLSSCSLSLLFSSFLSAVQRVFLSLSNSSCLPFSFLLYNITFRFVVPLSLPWASAFCLFFLLSHSKYEITAATTILAISNVFNFILYIYAWNMLSTYVYKLMVIQLLLYNNLSIDNWVPLYFIHVVSTAPLTKKKIYMLFF